MTYLRIHNLGKTFISPGGAKTKALQQVTLDLDKGKVLSVIGHNGSGKTTLLNCIRRYCDYDTGEILVNGKDIQKSLPRIVSVHQDVDAGVVGSMSTIDCLALVMSDEPSFLFSFPVRKYRDRIFEFLDSVGLAQRFSGFEHTRVADLSGGQRQQLAIVMAMLRRPELLLLDEFVANLDPTVSRDILDWSKRHIHEKRITTIMVTHNHNLAESWGDHVLELSEGQVVRFANSASSGGSVH